MEPSLLHAELLRLDRLLLHAAERRDDRRASAWLRELAADHGERRLEPADRLAGPGVLPGLERTRAIFRLTEVEREVLLVALAPELDERYGHVLARLQGAPACTRPCVGLIARLLAHAGDGGAALAPGGHLHHTGLVEIGGGGPHAQRAVSVAEAFWPRLVGLAAPAPFQLAPPAALGRLVLAGDTRRSVEAALTWARRRGPHQVLIAVDVPPGSGRESLAAAIAGELDLGALVVDDAELAAPEQTRALVREAAWHPAAVIVRGATAPTIARIAGALPTPILALAGASLLRELAGAGPRTGVAVTVAALAQAEREALWTHGLAGHPRGEDVDVRWLASQFRFGPGQIGGIVATAVNAIEARGEPALTAAALHEACRTSTASGSLAVRVECPYDEADLVVPVTTRRELALIAAWARHGAAVFRADAAGARIRGGGGLVCLFGGPPGTGKTMSAQVLARRLHLDLLVVDLSQVVNKYIGETEKNLDRVFAQAEATGALLFFDEADALFGRRTDVASAHDRYANLETGFLLQRLERHPGIVILATNLMNNLDAAFLRRIHVVAEFPIPAVRERREIWERHLVRDHLAGDVDPERLAAMFEISGGAIRNAVVTAVLLAAAEQTTVAMRHLVSGLWRELNKAGRLTLPDEFGPWRNDVVAYARSGQA